MKCDHCGAPNATIHLTEIINGEVSEVHLCAKCSKTNMQEYQKNFNMTDFLSDLVDLDDVAEEDVSHVVCDNCGLTYELFKKIGRVGCAQCYSSFHEQLLPLLRKIHTAVRHKGKMPLSSAGEDNQQMITRIKELKEKLELAIKNEEFEAAALIRDEIKTLEKKLED